MISHVPKMFRGPNTRPIEKILEKPVICRCGEEFFKMSTFYRHKRSVHENHEVQCQECDMVLQRKSTLKKHMQVYHTAGGQMEFRCSLCKKVFLQQKLLAAHKRSAHSKR